MAVATPNPAQAIPEHRLICRVCEKQYSKYTCPQCNLRYCSLGCYKNHSLRCTETFMRNNVIEEMQDIQATKESQQSMLEALRRIHFDEAGRSIFEDENLLNEDVEDDDDIDDSQGTILSEKTVKLIAKGDNISLDDLSDEERRAFLRAVAAGEFSHLIQPWNPWWLNPRAKSISITVHGMSLVQSVYPSEQQSTEQARTDASEAAPGEVPTPPAEALAQVRQLMHGDPSPLVSIHLAEVIYSYCFTLRFCNGDWQSEPLEAALILLGVSQVLSQAASPESLGVALAEAVKTICSPSLKHVGGFKFAAALFDDSVALLRLGRACVVCGLADLHRMLERAKRDLKAELGADEQGRVKRFRDRSRFLDSSSNSSSTVINKPSTGPGATQNSSTGGAREKGTQGTTYAELRKTRDSKRGSDGNRNPLSTVEANTRTGFNGRRSSTRASAFENQEKKGKSSMELRKLTAAIRKIYFLMCWTNEQPSEVFLSLALLVDGEKDKLLEAGMTQNIGVGMIREVKAPVTKSGPIIEEIVENSRVLESKLASKVEVPMVSEVKALGPEARTYH